jgi:DNA protecting protein DprA
MFAESPRADESQQPHGSDSGAPKAKPTHQRGPALGVADFDLQLLALGLVRGLGVHALRALIDAFGGDLERVWAEDTATVGDLLARARVKEARRVASDIANKRSELLADAGREREALEAENVRIIGMHDPAFPRQLAQFDDGPYWLFVQGAPAALTATAHIAIVGTRDATPAGMKTAERLAYFVVKNGLGIVSGLAEGIDAAAQRVAAYYEVPQVAVLGTGIRHVFPASTRGLRKRIVADGGAVISEYLPDENYGKANFVQRNRIQAALASAVCPVEGRTKGGTAHTLGFAERYGRSLFGVYRSEILPSNELAIDLQERGSPVFDLDSDPGVSQLLAFLHAVDGLRGPIPDPPTPEKLFNEVLSAFDELTEDVAISAFDANWLMRRIAQRFSLPAPPPPANGNGKSTTVGHGG